jgi:hypothetical protein
MCNGFNTRRPTSKNTLKCIEVSAVKTVETQFVDSLHLKCCPRYLKINNPISPTR